MRLRLSAQAIREVQALADSPVVLRKQASLPLCKADKWITTIDGELQWTISRQPQQRAAVEWLRLNSSHAWFIECSLKIEVSESLIRLSRDPLSTARSGRSKASSNPWFCSAEFERLYLRSS